MLCYGSRLTHRVGHEKVAEHECVYISGSKCFSTLYDTQTPPLPIFLLAFIQVSFVHSLLYSFHPVYLRSSSCSLLFRHPLQCYFGQTFFCHSLNMAIPCELVLFSLFYNCFLQSNLLSYSYNRAQIQKLILVQYPNAKANGKRATSSWPTLYISYKQICDCADPFCWFLSVPCYYFQSFYLTVYVYSNIEGYYRGTCHVTVLYLTTVTKELWLLFAYFRGNIDKNVFLQMAYEKIQYSHGVSLYAASEILIFIPSLVCTLKPKDLYAN